MEIEVLNEFLCLSRELNYTAAAQKLFVSQSVLSRHIANLEKELDCILFARNKRSVELTRAGRVLATRADELIAIHNEIISEVKREEPHQMHCVRVGYLSGASAAIVLAGKRLFKHEFPDVAVKVKSLLPQEMRNALNKGDFDIIVSIFPKGESDSSLACKLLYEDTFSLMMRPSHVLAGYDEVPVAAIAQPIHIPEGFPYEDALAEMIPTTLAGEGVPFDITEMVDNVESFPMAFETKDWVSISCMHLKEVYGSRFSFVPIEGVDLRYDVCAAWRKTDSNLVLDKFVESLCIAREMLAEAMRDGCLRKQALP